MLVLTKMEVYFARCSYKFWQYVTTHCTPVINCFLNLRDFTVSQFHNSCLNHPLYIHSFMTRGILQGLVEVLSGLVRSQIWHLITGCHLCMARVPQVAMLRTCPNLTLAVEWDVKSQL